MARNYDSKLFRPLCVYEGTDNDMLEHLTNIFSGNTNYNSSENNTKFSSDYG